MKIMKIQINTDNHIPGRETLVAQAEATITSALGHLAKHVTRVEVHLSDENGEKIGGRDKRCMMEARLEGRQPSGILAAQSFCEQEARRNGESHIAKGGLAGVADLRTRACAKE
jgi:hypothetical protein